MPEPRVAETLSVAAVLDLQRSAGNRAVARLLQPQPAAPARPRPEPTRHARRAARTR